MYPITDLNNLEIAFPYKVSHLMPTYEDIPSEFKRWSNKWNRLAQYLFSKGLSKEAQVVQKSGVDVEKAFNQIQAILSSFEPSHEHKLAGVAFLLNEWFEDIQIENRV
jgi:hypothetical protein